jgi:hypothetical protein
VVTELAQVYLSGLDQPTRAVLDAACTLRRPTLSLLGALLPNVPPHEAYDMLRPLPFVEFGPDGLGLHVTVREVVAALLRVNDPPAYRAHRIAAWRQLRRELRAAPADGPVALHRRPALPHREPGGAGGVLPHRQPPVRGRASSAGR